MDPRCDQDRRIDAVLTNLATCYECFDLDSFRLPEHTQRRLKSSYEKFALEYRWLCWEALQGDIKRWHEVPNFHVGFHLVLQSRFMNPRFGWCYGDEDFEGVLKLICQRCTAGTPAHEVVSKVVRRWGHGVALRVALNDVQ